MLNFVLCDDNKNILDKLSQMLNNIFINHDYNAKLPIPVIIRMIYSII